MGANNGPVFGLNNHLGGNNLGNNLANNMGNNGQNDEAKETTQVTIPKDVSVVMCSNWIEQWNYFLFRLTVGRCNYWKSWNTHTANPYGIKCLYNDWWTSTRIIRSDNYNFWHTTTNTTCTVFVATKVRQFVFSFFFGQFVCFGLVKKSIQTNQTTKKKNKN